jgi:hypothetical protein
MTGDYQRGFVPFAMVSRSAAAARHRCARIALPRCMPSSSASNGGARDGNWLRQMIAFTPLAVETRAGTTPSQRRE